MDAGLVLDLAALRRVCEQYGVGRLQVFGSSTTDRFDPERSDVDFLVDFLPGRADAFDDYFGLREQLVELLGREVDLVVAQSVRNPYFLASAQRDARDVYAA